MKKILIALAAMAFLVGTPAVAGNHVAVKIQGYGINLSPATGATLGYVGATVDTTPVTDKDGKPLDASSGVCSRNTSVNTFTNMNGHASATATNVPTGAGGVISNINGPSIAAAAADESANGGAAIIAAASMTANPSSVIDAYCGNPVLTNAPQGTQIRPSGQ